jgi:aspartyl-tRNA(Asn)/glutamyl-tRNA(Gln) amidotransferase subunit C
MALSRAEVQRVALLARLQFSDDELDQITSQLAQIVEYVEQLSELDTSHVQPMAHAVEMANVFADDVVRSSFDRDRILANAPKRDDQCYCVPAVLGD